MENLRKLRVNQFDNVENTFIVDSMPLEIVKMLEPVARKYAKRINSHFQAGNYCIWKSSYYYSYKLHALPSVALVFKVLTFLRQAFTKFIFFNIKNQQLQYR